ncbi:sigma-K factor [Mycobacterium phage Kimona]|uniref:Helix-turn-helix DNA binding protein n=1 Tax=Mycobacterium phage Kimona TaxID=2024295 RepID=A0A249XU74_9CAUD|nr:sigma-K factor [Mycobacterium phage Kimona]ASZ75487.1 helix-turn-helix DNA binding protein [Mycobacterium phage Kimona]
MGTEVVDDASVKAVAKSALAAWGSDVTEVDDLAQEIHQWYLERPSVQKALQEAEDKRARDRVLYHGARQVLVEKTFEADEAWGRNLYSTESIKAHLKGQSTNKFLRRVMPQALARLQRQNPDYAEVIEFRYELGGKPDKDMLLRAHRALTRQVNIIAIDGEEEDLSATPAESRKAKGGMSDPTADVAIALIEKGDEVIELEDKEGNVIGTTTYRTELANVFDEFMTRNTVDYMKESRSHLSVIDGGLLGDRASMYQAAVFPDVFPDEPQMLVDNWSDEDRAMYCGGEYTPGYLRLVKGGA